MYILTNHKNVIIAISETIDYQSNGNPLVDNGSLAFAKNQVKEVYEVAEVPEEVIEGKYCYTEEKGFYISKYWTEPTVDEQRLEALEVQNVELEKQITNTQLAMFEMLQMIPKKEE